MLLATLGVTLFLTNQGTASLPQFYVGFALVAITLSFGLGAIVDRCARVRLAKVAFVGVLVLAAGCRPLLDVGFPGAPAALLCAATVFEILIDILLWAILAAHLDAFAYKRVIPPIYMALAVGGALGGALARLGMTMLEPADLLLALIPLAAVILVQLEVVEKSLPEVSASHHDAGLATRDCGLGSLPPLLRRTPLAMLIALSALFVTLLYGLAEFLVFKIYEVDFASEAELGQMLALVFAATQLIEFGLLFTLGRMLLERTGPLFRNLVFPLTSLAALAHLAINPGLVAAIIVQVNIDAVCNAVFLPVNNANYLAIPAPAQGRIRTLADGIGYPVGLALAGLLLMALDTSAGVAALEFTTLALALAFLLLGAWVGMLFLPTLVDTTRTGIVPFDATPQHAITLPPEAAGRVRALLQDPEPEIQLAGIAASGWLGPGYVTADLLDLADRADRRARHALVQLGREASNSWVEGFFQACATRGNGARIVALEIMLARRGPAGHDQLARLQTEGPESLALAHLLRWQAGPGDASRGFAGLVQGSEAASTVVEAIVAGGRTDLAGALGPCLEIVPSAQLRAALEWMASGDVDLPAAMDVVLARACSDPDPRTRAAAIALFDRTRSRDAAVLDLARALADRSALVRRRAADALAGCGDRAVAALGPWLEGVGVGSAEAAAALARIGTEVARRRLRLHLGRLRDEAARVVELEQLLRAAPRSPRRDALAICLGDYAARLGEVAIAVLSVTLAPAAAAHVRDAIRSDDPYERARALEVLSTATGRAGAADALEILRLQVTEPALRRGGDRTFPADALLARARGIADRWVRRAADPPDDGSARNSGMDLNERDLERVLLLKRAPLFGRLPLDTLASLAGGARPRAYRTGDELGPPGDVHACCHLIEAGTCSVVYPGRVRIIAASTLFNELALVGQPSRHLKVIALEPARVLSIHRVLFQDLCRDHPELLMELSRHLARRLHACGQV